ncbi:MAG TPA: DUF4382 domain-containing protein [Gemmatimonadales bacterium]|nr:DUF4382 domain-containing protein [Gemmatimonadales bacterium]
MTIRRPVQLLLALTVLLYTSACSVFTGSGEDGNVRVVMSASDQSSLAPSLSTSGDDDDDDKGGEHRGDRFLERLETANVTIASLLARNTDGQLIDLDMDLPQTIDLKALLGGENTTLPAGTLPAGDYDQLVVVMTKLDLTFVDGGALALTPPGGGWTSIVRVAPFTVTDGEDTTIELNFRMGGALREIGGVLKFFPDFDGHHR